MIILPRANMMACAWLPHMSYATIRESASTDWVKSKVSVFVSELNRPPHSFVEDVVDNIRRLPAWRVTREQNAKGIIARRDGAWQVALSEANCRMRLAIIKSSNFRLASTISLKFECKKYTYQAKTFERRKVRGLVSAQSRGARCPAYGERE